MLPGPTRIPQPDSVVSGTPVHEHVPPSAGLTGTAGGGTRIAVYSTLLCTSLSPKQTDTRVRFKLLGSFCVVCLLRLPWQRATFHCECDAEEEAPTSSS